MKCSNRVVQPCDACVELANLDATPSTSHNVLDLIQKRHHNKFNLNLSHDPLVSRFPNEIISHIFISLDKINKPENADDASSGDIYWDHLLQTPALLSMVCRRWRSIVLATPQLWTNLMFDVCTQSCKLELFEELLSRSGSLPLTLVLYGDKFRTKTPKAQLKLIANVIRSHSARWETLNINRAPIEMADMLLHKLDDIPTSDLFHLQALFFPEGISLREPLRPCHFALSTMGNDITPLRILRWDNMVSLKLNEISIKTLYNIFQQTPRLAFCYLTAMTIFAEAPLHSLPEGPIAVPSLEHLEVSFKQADSLLFRYLTLPGLTHLVCRFDEAKALWNTQEMPLEDLVNFMARSQLDSKSLRVFDLQYNIYSMNYDPRFIELTTITHLCIFIFDLNEEDDIIDSYLSRTFDISILPHLQEVHIWTPRMQPLSWALLCNIFQGGFLPFSDGPICSSGTTIMTLQNPSIQRRYHARPLKHVFLEVYGDESIPIYGDESIPIIPYEEYVLLQDIQNAGIVQLVLQDRAGANLLENEPKIY